MRTLDQFRQEGVSLRDTLAKGTDGVDASGRSVQVRMDKPGEVQVLYPKPEASRVVSAADVIGGQAVVLASKLGTDLPSGSEVGILDLAITNAWNEVYLRSAEAARQQLETVADDSLREPQYAAAVTALGQQRTNFEESTRQLEAAYNNLAESGANGVNHG